MSSPFLISAPLAAAWQQNDAIRFGTSGILGNAIFFGLDKKLFPVIVRTALRLSASDTSSIAIGSKWINKNAASVSFFVAYLLDIAVQRKSKSRSVTAVMPVVPLSQSLLIFIRVDFLNAWLVFGLDTIRTTELYFASLATSYTA